MKGFKKPSKQYAEIAYCIMVKFHWTVDYVANLPLPTVFALLKLMDWEQKEIEKAQKR